MDESASIGDTVNIETLAGRVVSGTLCNCGPSMITVFGRQQPTLMHAGNEVRKIMKEADKNE